MNLDLPPNHPALCIIRDPTQIKLLQAHGCMSSLFHSPTHVFPVNSAVEAIAAGVNRLDYVVVTIIDTNSPSKKDLIGQVIIKLNQVTNLSAGKPITLTLPLCPLKLEVKNQTGDSQVVSSRAPTGTVTLTLTRPMTGFNICGHIWKISDNLMAMGAWKKRWVNIVNGELQYFNSEFALESPKASVLCSTITVLEEETMQGKDAIKITYKVAKGTPSATWYLAFEDDLSKSVRRKWLRVLYRNCPQITAPVEISGKQKAREAAAKAKEEAAAKEAAAAEAAKAAGSVPPPPPPAPTA
jgi:hypothetical protein